MNETQTYTSITLTEPDGDIVALIDNVPGFPPYIHLYDGIIEATDNWRPDTITTNYESFAKMISVDFDGITYGLYTRMAVTR